MIDTKLIDKEKASAFCITANKTLYLIVKLIVINVESLSG